MWIMKCTKYPIFALCHCTICFVSVYNCDCHHNCVYVYVHVCELNVLIKDALILANPCWIQNYYNYILDA